MQAIERDLPRGASRIKVDVARLNGVDDPKDARTGPTLEHAQEAAGWVSAPKSRRSSSIVDIGGGARVP